MKIALLGATGAVGGHFLNKALAAGYEVKALVRTPEKLRKIQVSLYSRATSQALAMLRNLLAAPMSLSVALAMSKVC